MQKAWWTRETTPLDADRDAYDLILVTKGSAGALAFEHADTLKAGQQAPLTVTNYPGLAIVPTTSHSLEGAGAAGKVFNFVGAGVGRADRAVVGSVSPEGLVIRKHDKRALRVWWGFDPDWRGSGTGYSVPLAGDRDTKAMARDPKFTEGDKVVLQGGELKPTGLRGSVEAHVSCNFKIEADGTVSLQEAPHLVLGLRLPRLCTIFLGAREKWEALPEMGIMRMRDGSGQYQAPPSETRITLEHADGLRAGRSVPLTLSSHPGYAIVGVPRGEDELEPSGGEGSTRHVWGIGPASHAITARLEQQLLFSTDEASNGYVVSVEVDSPLLAKNVFVAWSLLALSQHGQAVTAKKLDPNEIAGGNLHDPTHKEQGGRIWLGAQWSAWLSTHGHGLVQPHG